MNVVVENVSVWWEDLESGYDNERLQFGLWENSKIFKVYYFKKFCIFIIITKTCQKNNSTIQYVNLPVLALVSLNSVNTIYYTFLLYTLKKVTLH